jgi:hypothetical protein
MLCEQRETEIWPERSRDWFRYTPIKQLRRLAEAGHTAAEASVRLGDRRKASEQAKQKDVRDSQTRRCDDLLQGLPSNASLKHSNVVLDVRRLTMGRLDELARRHYPGAGEAVEKFRQQGRERRRPASDQNVPSTSAGLRSGRVPRAPAYGDLDNTGKRGRGPHTDRDREAAGTLATPRDTSFAPPFILPNPSTLPGRTAMGQQSGWSGSQPYTMDRGDGGHDRKEPTPAYPQLPGYQPRESRPGDYYVPGSIATSGESDGSDRTPRGYASNPGGNDYSRSQRELYGGHPNDKTGESCYTSDRDASSISESEVYSESRSALTDGNDTMQSRGSSQYNSEYADDPARSSVTYSEGQSLSLAAPPESVSDFSRQSIASSDAGTVRTTAAIEDQILETLHIDSKSWSARKHQA